MTKWSKGEKMKLINSKMSSDVRKRRALERLTKTELANKIGITRQTITKVENTDNLIVQDRVFEKFRVFISGGI